MNMKQLRYVLTLAQEGSFSKAAAALNISQPSLSQYIKKIETSLGADLFDRTGGDVHITDAGKVYIEAGRKILDLEKQLGQQLEDIADGKAGSIVLGVSPHRCVHLMPEIVKRFHTMYPGIRLIIEERAGNSLLEDAEHGDFDLCIANLPVDPMKFHYQLMMQEEVLLSVNIHTPFYRKLIENCTAMKDRKYPAVSYRLIDGEQFVTLSEFQPTQKCLNELCQEANISINSNVECRTIETQFAMVRAGLGAALLPSSMAEFCREDQIAFFSFAQTIPFRDMAVVYRKDQYLSKSVRTLIDILTGMSF